MTESARLEIHVINVGQGDSILIVNRDLAALRNKLSAIYDGRSEKAGIDAANDIDLLPWAMKAMRDEVPGAATVQQGTVVAALLIDGGEDCYGPDVVSYLESQGVVTPGVAYCPKLSVLVTHYHSDHITGLWYLFKKERERNVPISQARISRFGGIEWRKKVETFHDIFPHYRPAQVYYTLPDAEKDSKTITLKKLRANILDAANAEQPTQIFEVLPGGVINVLDMTVSRARYRKAPVCIPLGTGVEAINIQLRIVASSGAAWNPDTDQMDHVDSDGTDQNDRSIVAVLEYGSFRAFLGGDIAGNGTAAGGNAGYVPPAGSKKFFSTHGDMEKVVMPLMRSIYPATATPQEKQPKFQTAGHCTVYKASHHASSSSNDIHTLSTLRPRVVAISSGIKERYHKHPTSEVLGRMAEAATWSVSAGGKVNNSVRDGVYITEMAETYREKGKIKTAPEPPDNVFLVGDIIIRPTDESISAIQMASGFGTPLKVQVFGTGFQSVMTDDDDTGKKKKKTKTKEIPQTLRPCEPSVGDGLYPIGPQIHSCDEH